MNSRLLSRAGALWCLALTMLATPAAVAAGQSRTTRRTPKTTRSVVERKTPRPAREADPPDTRPTGISALASSVDAALSSHTRSGDWGAIVVSLTRGDTLFARNADAMMQPASTMKLFTSALALDQFGPEYTFRTPVLHDGTISSDGTLSGNLYLLGVGDPSLSPRFWRDEAPMDALAKAIAAAGIRRVHGDIVGDATAFEDKLVPDGWKSSYLGAAYAARVSALSLNENLVWVAVRPAGGNALVTLEPPTTTIPVESTVRLVRGSRGSIRAARRSDGAIVVRGTIGSSSRPLKYSLVADNPALFTTGALRAALRTAGVTIDGETRLGRTPTDAVEVAAVSSPPLAQIIGEMDRESINLVAELLYRSAAHAATRQMATAETSLARLRRFLAARVGASPRSVDVSDGSGLSQLDRVTPRAMVKLLGYAHRAPWGPAFHAALPVEGESGTLRRRGRGGDTPARGNLHAKTGTTNDVAALGGFVTARNGEVLAFSLIYNGRDRANARAAMDEIGAYLADFVRE